MFQKVKKRDGRIVKFDPGKITKAIAGAGMATGEFDEKVAKKLTLQVLNLAQQAISHKIPTVEEIQDIVEEVLLSSSYRKTAKAYIIYREQHTRLREIQDKMSVDLVEQYLSRADWQVKENSNMTFSLQGLNNYLASEVSKIYWMRKIYPPEIREAYERGDFHVHDLGSLSAYCVGWDLQDLLLQGFKGVPGKTESKPANHFRTALGQVVNFFYTLQGESAGAQAFSSFDTLLAPFIRADHLNYAAVKQALQEFIFNMNVPTRVGFQTPYTNITLDLQPSPVYKDQPAIIGGKLQKETYGDFQKEMDMLNQALLEVMLEGDAKSRVFTFPIPTYNIDKNFNWDDEKLNYLWDSTAKFGLPYFANFINSDMKPEDVRSMCPLAGDEKVLIKSSRGRGVEYSSIKNIYGGNSKHDQYYIYSDGKFIKGKFNKFEKQEMIKVVLANKHELKISRQHLNFVITEPGGEEKVLKGSELKSGMYLPYSLNVYEGKGGNEDLGYFVGCYAGDGSFDGETSVIFSLENYYKKETITKLRRISKDYFGVEGVLTTYEDTKLVTLKIHSKVAVGLCKDFVAEKQRDKHYTARTFMMSKDFRRGVMEGHYATDGGNSNRIYTSSPQMVQTLNMLAATLGTATSIYKDDRKNRLGKEPNYAILIYQLNRKKLGDMWFKKNDKLWMKIKSIKPIVNNTAYCFEVEKGKPIFTVGTTGILTHNCRLRLDLRELRKKGGGYFGSDPLTGSIGVVTINLPRLGYLSKDENDFLKRLEKLMVLAKNSLEIKRKILERLTDDSLYPYSKFYLRETKKRFGSYWKNHFSTIGLIGMNEATLNLLGKNLGEPEAKAFALKVLDFMRDKLVDFQKETGNNYNLEATPAEGTAYRLPLKDKKQFPDIICANEKEYQNGAEPFYTNSTQLPVNYSDDIFEVLDQQDEIQKKYTGGTVLHIFAGERVKNREVIKQLVKKVCEGYHLPYFTFTPTFSICPTHGYLIGNQPVCPKCGAVTEVYSRSVGYLRPVSQWNKGKAEEFKERKTFKTE